MTNLAKIFWIFITITLSIQPISCLIYRARQKNPEQTGELVPCSARVALKITETIDPNKTPKFIMEVGAGSGALTPKIISKMKESDHLDLIEIEPLLCEALREKFGYLKNVSIQCVDFLTWQPNYQYDYVISTLPFNSFPPELVQRAVDQLVLLSKDKAHLGFVEFKWLSSFRMLGMNKLEKETFMKTREIIRNFYLKYKAYDTDVYMNFPPIIVYHLIIDKSKAAAETYLFIRR